MNRREFLAYSAAVSGAFVLNSCASTARYVVPAPIVRPEEKLVLANVSIVDVEAGAIARENMILIRRGKIAKLFTDDEWPEVTADKTLDLEGSYVMPGLINAHCHMSAPSGISMSPIALATYKRQVERNAEECVKHGVTTVRDMLSVSDFISGAEWLQEKIAREKIAGPRIQRAYAIDIDNSYGDWLTMFAKKKSWKQVGDAKQAKRAVRMAAAKGADLIKLFQQHTKLVMPCDEMPVMDQKIVDAVCEEAYRCNLPVAMHQMELAGLDSGVTGGVSSLEHVASDGPISDDVIESLLENGTYMVPTASVPFSYAFPMNGDPNWGTPRTEHIEEMRNQCLSGMINEFCEPEYARGSESFFTKYSDPASYESFHIIPWLCPKLFNMWANQGIDNTMKLYEAGVKFGCGNDGGVPFVFPGAMGHEMTLLEDMGMATADVLRMSTINNARLIGRERDLGAIKSPAIADLAVFKNNPLETAKNTLKAEMTFQGGKLTYKA